MRTVEAELLSLVLPLLGQGRDGDEGSVDGLERDALTTTEIVYRAHAALEGGDDIEPMTASLLARHVGVSARRLRDVFNEHYQIGPRHYLILRQLHRVRSDLLASRPLETTVTETLTSSGVWHFGRFATRYKSLFTESPNETLHRGSGIRSGSSLQSGSRSRIPSSVESG
jgi:AraC family ethanolamine operon transcriptional activator